MMEKKMIWTVPMAAAVLWAGCLFEPGKEAKRGTVVDNEVRVGYIFLANGAPANDAKVRLFPVDHLPDSGAAAFSARTDERGRYAVDSLPRGEYNILGERDGYYSFSDSVFISGQTGVVSQDTLGSPGSIEGVIGLQPDHNPITATVQVVGTHSFSNVDQDGRFRLDNLARGSYTLRILTTLAEYTPLFKRVTIDGGNNLVLEDTLWLPFTGIPVVRDIAATYDTLRGVVRLSWKPAAYRSLSDYLVFRDPATAIVPSYAPIGFSKDTVYLDTLYSDPMRNPFLQAPFSESRHRYRIRARDRSDRVGLSYGYVEISTPSPATVSTAIRAEVTEVKWDGVKQVDSIEVVADLSSPGRGLAEVVWALGRPDSVVATIPLEGRVAATSRLRFGWPREGLFAVYVRSKDVGGAEWTKIVWVPGNRSPQISLHPPDTIQANLPFRVEPTSSDPDRDVLRFSGLGLPSWMTVDSIYGTLHANPANQDTGAHPGIILTVSDGRRTRQAGPFTLHVKRNPWSKKAGMPFSGATLRNLVTVALGDRILAIQYSPGKVRQSFYNPATDEWSGPAEYDLPSLERMFWGHAVGGEAVVIGAENVEGQAGAQRTRAFYFNPSDSRWRASASSTIMSSTLEGVYTDGKFLMAANLQGTPYFARAAVEFDPASESWSIEWGSSPISHPFCFLARGKLHTVLGVERGPITLETYDPLARRWSKEATWPEPVGKKLFSFVHFDGKAYTIGGYSEWNHGGQYAKTNHRDDAYDLEEGSSRRLTDRLFPYFQSACLEHRAKILCFGGLSTPILDFHDKNSILHHEVEEYDPNLDN